MSKLQSISEKCNKLENLCKKNLRIKVIKYILIIYE